MREGEKDELKACLETKEATVNSLSAEISQLKADHEAAISAINEELKKTQAELRVINAEYAASKTECNATKEALAAIERQRAADKKVDTFMPKSPKNTGSLNVATSSKTSKVKEPPVSLFEEFEKSPRGSQRNLSPKNMAVTEKQPSKEKEDLYMRTYNAEKAQKANAVKRQALPVMAQRNAPVQVK